MHCAYIPSFVLEHMLWNSVNECVSMPLLAYKCVCVCVCLRTILHVCVVMSVTNSSFAAVQVCENM